MDVIFPNLGIKIEILNRVAFSLFGFNVYWYGVFICLGAMLGVALCFKEAERTGQNKDLYSDFVLWCLVSGIAGARMYYLIFHGDSLLNFFAIRDGGLAIYGGIIGGFLAAVAYCKIKNINFPLFADTVIMSVLCGQILGRWGNFFNREAFGKATDSLFTMCYKISQVGGAERVGDVVHYNNAIYPVATIDSVDYIGVHPTFLYESFYNLILLVFLLMYRKHKRFNGEIALFYFTFYGIGRFIIESIRTDQLMIFNVPVSMIVASLSAVVTIAIEVFMIKKQKSQKI